MSSLQEKLKQAQLEREARLKAKQQTEEIKEEKKQEVPDQTMQETPQEEQSEQNPDEGWGNDDDWQPDYGDEIQQLAKEEEQMVMLSIDFVPENFEHGTLPQICGDMTEWIPVNMNPWSGLENKGHFNFHCKVAKGFKYRFWFLYKGQRCLDTQNYGFSQNKDNELTNEIEIEMTNENEQSELKLARVITYNEQNVTKIQQVKLSQVRIYREKSELVQQMEEVEKIQKMLQKLPRLIGMGQAKQNELNDTKYRLYESENKLDVELLGRLAHIKGQPLFIFEIESFTYSQTSAKCSVNLRAVFDGIYHPILLAASNKQNNKSVEISQFDEQFEMLQEEREDWNKKLMQNEDSKFKVKYRVQDFGGQKEAVLLEVLPHGLQFHQYEIIYATDRQIQNVKHKVMGDVQFIAQIIDDDVGLTMNSMIELWTHRKGMIFNILHIHLQDSSENTTVDVQYLTKHDYHQRDIPFGKDAMGVPIRYKFLVFDFKIRDVLYNDGKDIRPIPFKEYAVQDSSFKIIGKFLSKIREIPLRLLSTPDQTHIDSIQELAESSYHKIFECSARQFDKLSGYVDLEVLSKDSNLVEQPIYYKVPICQLKEVSSDELEIYQLLVNSKKDQARNAILAVIDKVTDVMNASGIDPKEQLARLKEQIDELELIDTNKVDAEMKAKIEQVIEKADSKKVQLGRAIRLGAK